VSPAHTSCLNGTPNELKLKYFADNDFANLTGEELEEAMRAAIAEKDGSLVGSMQSQGTTPRRYSDLIGSLCDLVSGSGDRGTPVVYIKGYFTNFATE
ncbi:MAG: coenzyme F420-0:L-glutamate ligase, partial [Oscillospiraceae bacterium]|nr:coenzyme F420-0:L-glutamate ligase [Oscillospiraceae bacterium]